MRRCRVLFRIATFRVVLPPFGWLLDSFMRVWEWASKWVSERLSAYDMLVFVRVCVCVCCEERVSAVSVLIVSAHGEFVSFEIWLWQWEEHSFWCQTKKYTHIHWNIYTHSQNLLLLKDFHSAKDNTATQFSSQLNIKTCCSHSVHIISQRQLVTVTT